MIERLQSIPVLAILAVLSITTVLNAQDRPFSFLYPPIRNFTPEMYRAQYQNWDLVQSVDGWIYIANNSGLLEFDGARWTLYPLPHNQPARTVHTTSHGDVLVGGFEFIGKFDGPSARSSFFEPLNQTLQNGLAKEEIWHAVQKNGLTYFQSFSMIYERDSSGINPILPPSNLMFLQEVNERLLFQAIDGGLYEFTEDRTFVSLPGTQSLSDKTVSFILPLPQDSLLVGTSNHGAFVYLDGQLKPWDNPVNVNFIANQLNKGIQLENGGFAFGTISNGVYILDSLGQLIYIFNKDVGLQNNTVLSMMEDRDGNLWVGLDKGIDMIELNNPLGHFYDLSGEIGTVYTAAIDRDVLYIGSNQGVFYRPVYGDQSGVNNSGFKLVEGTQGQVWRLHKSKGELLCGHNNGTYKIKDSQSRKISDITGGWDFSEVAWNDEILIQSVYSGLVKYEYHNSDKWRFTQRIDGFSEAVKQIKFDIDGHLWAVHPQRGLFKLKLNESCDQVLEWKSYGKAHGIANDYQLAFIHWNEDIVVKGDCFYKYNAELDQFECFFPDYGYGWDKQSTWIYGHDSLWFCRENNDFWIGSGNSLKRQFVVSLVPKFENIVYEPDFIGGLYLFCQVNGFSILFNNYLDTNDMNERSYPIILRSVNASSRKSGSLDLSDIPQPELSAHFNNLTFEFAQAKYDRQPTFQYRLVDIHPEWKNLATGATNLSMQNLSPKNYTLEVKTNSSSQVYKYNFTILKPWYSSNWAMMIYAILLILCIYAFFRYLDFRLEKERKSFEARRAEEAKKQIELESRRQLEQEVELKNRELAHSAMTIVRKNEVLYELKNTLKAQLNKDQKSKDIIRMLDEHIESEQEWQSFLEVFNKVHDDFFKKLQTKFFNLTPGDLKLAAYLRLNLSTKEIAPLLNISIRGVENKRYRLRKKMGLSEDTNLTEFMINFD